MNVQNFKNISYKEEYTIKPITIIINNLSEKRQNCKIFFGDEFNNYGNDSCINISAYNETYKDILNRVRTGYLETSLIRMQSETIGQPFQTNTIVYNDGTEVPIIVLCYDGPRWDSKINDIPYRLSLDMDLFLSISILPETQLKIIFFPSSNHRYKNSKEQLEETKRFIEEQNKIHEQRRDTKQNI